MAQSDSKSTVSLRLPTTRGSPGCSKLLNSSGYQALVGDTISSDRTERICTYDIELIDWEKSVQEAINLFAQLGSQTFSDLNGNCKAMETTPQCKSWDAINKVLLRDYCQRTSYFPPAINGGCPNYTVNYLAPDQPSSQGCSNMVNTQSVCFNWKEANIGGIYQTQVNKAMNGYCELFNTQDCACINATDSVIFRTVNPEVPSRCWWIPCQSTQRAKFLIPPDLEATTCAQDVCIQVNNVFADDAVLSGLTINEYSACGNDPQKFPWYEQWWFWIILLTVIVLLFGVIIFYTSGG